MSLQQINGDITSGQKRRWLQTQVDVQMAHLIQWCNLSTFGKKIATLQFMASTTNGNG